MAIPRDAATLWADQIIGRSQITSDSASTVLRERLVEQLAEIYEQYAGWPSELQSRSEAAIREYVDQQKAVQRSIVTMGQVMAWIAGAYGVASIIPDQDELRRRIWSAIGGPPPSVSEYFQLADAGDGPVLTKLEQAVKDLQDRQVVTPEEFYDVANYFDRRANFTVSRFDKEIIEKIRQELIETIAEGADLKEFERRMEDAAIHSPLGPSHMETVHRTNTMTAIAEGEDAVLDDPIVANVFVYSRRIPIYDNRLTELCEIIAKSGINGTGIYRRDDPIYKLFRRPSHFNCRCSEVYLTPAQAAAEGIAEAQVYQSTGVWPSTPTHVAYPTLTPDAQKTWDSWTKTR